MGHCAPPPPPSSRVGESPIQTGSTKFTKYWPSLMNSFLEPSFDKNHMSYHHLICLGACSVSHTFYRFDSSLLVEEILAILWKWVLFGLTATELIFASVFDFKSSLQNSQFESYSQV